jgi:hypothetical protein
MGSFGLLCSPALPLDLIPTELTMPNLWKRLLARGGKQAASSAKGPLGGIELITPSLITGWAYHPDVPLSDVRLLVGPHLVGQARLDQPRPDVADHLQVSGNFGFSLDIPADLPLLRIEATPLVLALSADGSQRFPLALIGARASTQERLSVALQPELRGLRGHFDGLSPDGSRLLGWCYKVGARGPASVWLHAENLPPRELICNEYRPGMASLGHSETCGFSLALADCPEASGSTLWVTYDPEGLLRLPQAMPVQLPSPQAAPSEEISSTVLLPPEPIQEVVPHGAPEDLSWPRGATAEHWQALDGFRRYLDGLEQELDRHDAIHLRLPPRPKGFWARLTGSGF